jgi:hypothetical protein
VKNKKDKTVPNFDMIQKSLATEWQTRLDKEVPDDSPQKGEKKDNNSTV